MTNEQRDAIELVIQTLVDNGLTLHIASVGDHCGCTPKLNIHDEEGSPVLEDFAGNEGHMRYSLAQALMHQYTVIYEGVVLCYVHKTNIQDAIVEVVEKYATANAFVISNDGKQCFNGELELKEDW